MRDLQHSRTQMLSHSYNQSLIPTISLFHFQFLELVLSEGKAKLAEDPPTRKSRVNESREVDSSYIVQHKLNFSRDNTFILLRTIYTAVSLIMK